MNVSEALLVGLNTVLSLLLIYASGKVLKVANSGQIPVRWRAILIRVLVVLFSCTILCVLSGLVIFLPQVLPK